ncbi:MAG: T9SS type A sorting domain-containing protein [Ignavibacteria bacterium]
MKKLFLLSLALVLATFNLFSTIKNVPSGYSTIQAAITASVNGDTILVAPGTYMENINFRGKNIVLTSTFYINNDPAMIIGTIINGSTPVNADTGSCVIISNHEDSTTVLQGFSITGGSGTKWNDEHFAGVYREGGGLLVQYSSPVIKNNFIYDNIVTNVSGVNSTGGGGVRIGDSYVRFYNNVVMNNTAHYGAGVVLNYTGGEYKNNVICANYGSNQFGSGSGMWLNNTFNRPCIITNNTISGNSSTAGFCGVYGGSFASLRNNIIWGNTSPSNTQVSTSMNIIYSNIQGGSYPGSGNMSQNPLFADSNYVLQSGSPCIDKGDSSVIYNDIADPNNGTLALYPSRGGLRNDMGAYGGPLARLLSNGLIGIPNIGTHTPVNYALYQNYPNPFNPNTKITFDIPKSEFTKLIVYDVLGKETAIILNEFTQAGRYTVDFSASTLSSGIYFYTLQSGNIVLTKKMVLTK